MTTLRKKILYSKIQNIITQNKFVFFFQFNNIKFKDWILLKNQLLNFQNTSIMVIKNNITRQMLDDYISVNSNNSMISENLKYCLFNHKKQLCFLCQGPTLLLAFNSIQQCQIIYEILNIFTYNLPHTKHMLKLEKNIFNLYECKTNSLENRKISSIFKNNKLIFDTKQYSLLNLNNEKLNLFFIGGLVQGKVINHLDFEKLSNLNNSVYGNLIIQYYSKLTLFSLLSTVLKIKLTQCFKINLIDLLHLHKNNIKNKN